MIRKFFLLTFTVLLLCIMSSQAMATPVPALISFTNPSVWYSQDHSLGYKFSVNSDIDVTALGFFDYNNDGLAYSHEVGIWDAAATLLASVTFLIVHAGTPPDPDSVEVLPFYPNQSNTFYFESFYNIDRFYGVLMEIYLTAFFFFEFSSFCPHT